MLLDLIIKKVRLRIQFKPFFNRSSCLQFKYLCTQIIELINLLHQNSIISQIFPIVYVLNGLDKHKTLKGF